MYVWREQNAVPVGQEKKDCRAGEGGAGGGGGVNNEGGREEKGEG